MTWLAIALGGAAGALARHGISRWAMRFDGPFPWGTFAANMLGCLLIGLLMQVFLKWPLGPALRTGLTTGFLGALTTFSTFSWQTLQAVERGDLQTAATNVVANLVVGLAAVALGAALARLL